MWNVERALEGSRAETVGDGLCNEALAFRCDIRVDGEGLSGVLDGLSLCRGALGVGLNAGRFENGLRSESFIRATDLLVLKGNSSRLELYSQRLVITGLELGGACENHTVLGHGTRCYSSRVVNGTEDVATAGSDVKLETVDGSFDAGEVEFGRTNLFYGCSSLAFSFG